MLILAAAATAAALSGLWAIDGGEDIIRFEPCGEAVCATIVGHKPNKSAAQPDPFCNALLLKNLSWNPKSNRWEGRVLDPTTGKDYSAAVTLKSDRELTLRAWLGAEFLGRSYRYTPFRGRIEAGCRIVPGSP